MYQEQTFVYIYVSNFIRLLFHNLYSLRLCLTSPHLSNKSYWSLISFMFILFVHLINFGQSCFQQAVNEARNDLLLKSIYIFSLIFKFSRSVIYERMRIRIRIRIRASECISNTSIHPSIH